MGTFFHSAMRAVVAALFVVAGCGSSQKRFSSPEEAADALIHASKAEQRDEVKRILGRGADDVVSSGDEVADRHAREKFLSAYDEKHSVVADPDGSMTLQVGSGDWPMPIPIVGKRNAWRFDTLRGKDEILNRRIGRNELSVMQVCLAVVDAQREFESMDRNGDGVREYAQKFMSDPDKHNGLYWEAGTGDPQSPLGPFVVGASEEGYSFQSRESEGPRPFHGYKFRILKSQGSDAAGGARNYVESGRMTGGFAVVAWPAEHGNSGIMTFIVNQNGVLFERDLGRRTSKIAAEMTEFDPDSKWKIVDSVADPG
ncbi:MAG: DUF2950 domain-containing protein [Planctomycetes bacterium]|nr:DUF2950 domain-containing protein [Planctomycetota bacterium]MBI3835399.1 DUF2950 domain-containing protein [Planctomycetota bacterium]